MLKNCPCRDCGVETLPCESEDRAEYYMVTNDLWDSIHAVPRETGYLCIGCLEARLGRELRGDDFTHCEVNNLDKWTDNQRYAWSYRTPRLTARLAD